MGKDVKVDFQLAPDTGELKHSDGEFSNLQNIRGWGKLGSKRRGIQFSTSLSGGVMGMFDLQIDGDPTSPNKILVVCTDGNFYLYDYSEFITVFDFMFDTGFYLLLQAPDLTWWRVSINATTGIPNITGVVAPINTITQDQFIPQSQIYGFKNSSNAWRIFVGSAGNIKTQSYATPASTVLYTSNQAFETGFGPVFQDSTFLNNWRIKVANGGILGTVSI